MAARMAAGSPASAWKAAAVTPFACRARTPAASRASLRATSATPKPSAPNFSATALDTPGPKPTTTMAFGMGAPQRSARSI
jgi:hypothetical protein